MAISSIEAGKTLCEISDWTMSNLRLQKVLYIAHMVHLGVHKAPLISDHFEAWNYGPVAPELYHHAKGFGSNPVRNVFHWEESAKKDSTEYKFLADAEETTSKLTTAQLISITHRDYGAWFAVYDPKQRFVRIENDLILEEYHAALTQNEQNQNKAA